MHKNQPHEKIAILPLEDFAQLMEQMGGTTLKIGPELEVNPWPRMDLLTGDTTKLGLIPARSGKSVNMSLMTRMGAARQGGHLDPGLRA